MIPWAQLVNGILFLVGGLICRRGRLMLGNWIALGSFNLAVLFVNIAAIGNLGYVSALVVVVLTTGFASISVPKKEINQFVLLSLANGATIIIFDAFTPVSRPEITDNTFSAAVIAILVVIFGMFIARQFKHYDLQAKLTVTLASAIILVGTGTAVMVTNALKTTLTEEIGKGLTQEAWDHASIISEYLAEEAGQIMILSIVDTIKEQTIERNASYSGSQAEILAEIKAIDERWKMTGDNNSLVSGILSTDRAENPAGFQLEDFIETFDEHTEILITDRYGALVTASEYTADYFQGDNDLWQDAWNDGRGAISIDLGSTTLNETGISFKELHIAVPILDERTGEVIGVILSTLALDNLKNYIHTTQVGESGHFTLFDSEGSSFIEGGARENDVRSKLPVEIYKAELVPKETEYFVTTDEHGDEVVLGIAGLLIPIEEIEEEGESGFYERSLLESINSLGWIVTAAIPTEEAFAEVTNITRVISLVTIFTILVLLVAAVRFAHQITDPIAELAAAAEQFGAGNLGARIELTSKDEIGELAVIFNQMAAQLQNTLAGLENRNLELEAAYQELRQNQEMLLATEKMASLGRLTAGIAHEMNTPLAAVRASLANMGGLIEEFHFSISDQEYTPDDHDEITREMKEVVQLAEKAATRTADFIGSIKSQTREMTTQERQRFDPVPVIQEALLLLSHKLLEAGCTVDFDSPGDKLELHGSTLRLSQVVTNLVLNAIDARATADGGPISLKLTRRGDGIELQVRDSGKGISPQDLPKIFDPMFTTKPFGEGTGLGLTIVRDIVTGEFGGTISVDSQPGGDTTFTIYFPNYQEKN